MQYSQYDRYMTDNMLNLLATVGPEMEKDYLYCDEQYQKFNTTQVRLPHVNERGINVVHGANNVFYHLAQYWLIRRDAAIDYLSDEFIVKHNVNRYIRHG